jgi:plastocyanin
MRSLRHAPRLLSFATIVGLGLAWAVPVLAADQTVTMTGSTFDPATVTIQAGDTVTWTNADQLDHDATANDGSWATATFGLGGSGAVTFQMAGTYPYYCTIHPGMTGTVIVQAAATPAPTNAPTNAPTSAPTAPATDVSATIVPPGDEASVGSSTALMLIVAGGAAVALLAIRRRRQQDARHTATGADPGS